MTTDLTQDIDLPDPTDQPLCGCGRSSTGFCVGLHKLSAEEWDRKMHYEAEFQHASNELIQSQPNN